MKKRMAALALLLTCALLGACAPVLGEGKTFVTSFYPMYIFTLNIVRDVPGVSVENLAGENAGCLHDYQLKTRDMVKLEKADALIINGGGMEQFMDRVAAQQPQLAVIHASEGVEMLCSEAEHDHGGVQDDHAHEHEMLNAHVWLNPALACVQVSNIAEGLAALDGEHAEAYRENARAYIARIQAMSQEIEQMLSPFTGKEIVTFHESFTYFADAYGLRVAAVMSGDSGEEPSTREIARLCDLVSEKEISALFVEPQYPAKAAETIARETGAQIVVLDPVVSGDAEMESYETAMLENARIMTEAFSK